MGLDAALKMDIKKIIMQMESGKSRLSEKKEWSGKGVLVKDVRLPEYYKEFDENGKISVEATGTVVEENGSFMVQDGVVKTYAPDGLVKESTTYKDFRMVTE